MQTPALKGSVGASVTGSASVSTPTTLTPVLPAHASGDLLLCYTTCTLPAPTVATPSGWTLLGSVPGTVGKMVLFGKIAASGSETNPACVWSGLTTGTGGSPVQARCAVFTGAQLSVDVLGTVENGAASSTVGVSGTAITTLTNNDLVLSLSVRLDDAGTWAMPSGFTVIGSAGSTSGTDMSSCWSYQVKTTAGSVAPADYTITSGQTFASCGVLIALKAQPTTLFGVVACPITVGIATSGQVRPRQYGATSLPVAVGIATAGYIPPSSPYAIQILADGAQGYWRMEEVGLPQDSSPSSFHMMGDINTVPQVAGLLPIESTSKARGFIAAGSFLNRDQTYLMNTFSIELWIKRTRTNVLEVLLDQYNGGLQVVINSDGTFYLGKSFWGSLSTTSALKILDTNAHHIVITRNGIGGAIVYYLDGVSETPTPTNPNYDLSDAANNSFFIGSQWGNYPFDGTLDEVAIYPTVLSPAQVANHYAIATQTPTYYGQIAQAITFSKDVNGFRKTFGQTAVPLIFTKDVKGVRKTFSQSAFPITFSKDVQGQRKAFGQIVASFVFSKDVRGQRKTFGQITFPITATIATAGSKLANTLYGIVALPITFAKDVNGVRKAFGQTATSITFIKDVKGVRKTFSQLAFPITFAKEVVGRKISFGQLSMQTLFGKEVAGIRKVFGQIAFPITFAKDTNGQRKTFGQLLSPLIFGKDVRGQRQTFGQTVSSLLVSITTAGIKRANTFYGVLSLPVVWAKDVKGVRKTFGQTVLPIIFAKDVTGIRKTFGKVDLPLIFIKEAVGREILFGQLSMQTLFGKEVAGRRKTFGQIAFPVIFLKEVSSHKQTFGNVVLQVNAAIDVSGIVRGTKKFGTTSLPVMFGKEINGRRRTFGQVIAPFIIGSASKGSRRAFGKFELPLDFEIITQSGRVGTYGVVELELILSMDIYGEILITGIILNDALELYLGDQDILAAYVGSEKVWRSQP